MIRPRLTALLALPVAALALTACSTSSGADTSNHGQGNANTASTASGGLLSHRVPAPTLAGDTIGGGTLSTASYRGSVVVVNFYASWCAPCAAETPLLERTAQADPAVRFVGVLSNDSATNGEAFRRTYHVTYPSLVDSGGADVAKFRSLSPSGLPVTFVIDKQGRVAARYVGGISATAGFATVLSTLEAQ